MAAAMEPAPDSTLEAKLDDLNIEGKWVQFTKDTKPEPITPEVVAVPLSSPSAATIIPPVPELTTEQHTKYDAVLQTVKLWKEVAAKEDLGGPITEDECMWLTRECILRYLRATKWIVAEAEKRLSDTLTWRRDFGVLGLTADHMSPENETGKQVLLGYDIAGRPCHYLNPGRQNTAPSHRQVEHLVFMVERVLDLGLPGQDTLALLVNFKASKSRTNTSPGIGIAREILNILQIHYPERLGRALIINMPWIVNGFFKLISPFIDPMTREKLKFGGDMRSHVPPEQLWNEFQGDLVFEYDHSLYWPALQKMCEERRLAKQERWVKAGKIIGESEFYLKGGDAPSIGGSAAHAQNGSEALALDGNISNAVPSTTEEPENATVEPPQIVIQDASPIKASS
ncbi:CRAL-TRIO domain-containing protein [Calycina marina]|uniref:CRAL-TRIO domain-containing protein n=1 Tax=Calycina marina TaxID=1763456 RepID=A0A9P8CIY2_9HELO|nr:CRAL-TRIO domain-containing protein [Calycina marina]